uniref:fimbria/pilus outer membrane usher protein n=1 Tax=Serratia proteamaculans TaxID=28151 RepID=UPI001F4C4F0C|nr:fimbria/pilus outer membrane usher protein [Serratia proteamaculans]
MYIPGVWAETYFNPYALDVRASGQSVADLSTFDRGAQLPGRYRVDIYLNKDFIETREVDFVTEGSQLAPSLTKHYWNSLGIRGDSFPTLAALPDDAIVTMPGKYIPNAFTAFDFNQLRLNISIPQAALDFRARDYVSPEQWDQGMPAFLLNYGLNTNNSWQRKNDAENSNLFLRLDSGFNLGSWRLRNNSTYTHTTGKQPDRDEDGRPITTTQTSNQWQSLNTYAQRDIHALASQLTLGESSTPGDLFDSVQFRGVQLASDDTMQPDSLQGFAPVVRGIARTNAQVFVRQNGAVIYQTFVAPGAFEIKDLYPTASSGNLDVTIREDDGSESTFTQPFSSVPGMQREGRLRYAVTGGKYRSWSSDVREPNFLQSTLQYGLTNSTTTYGGGIFSRDYQSGLLGIGQGLGFLGSVSVDVTQAKSQFDNGVSKSGQSYRAQYSKDIFQSGTSFVLAGYRYSTSGFYDFREANELLPLGQDDGDWDSWRRSHNKRSKMQAQVSQQLGDYGSLSLSAYQQNYWQTPGNERTVMLGYRVNYRGITYSLDLSDTQYPQSDRNRRLSFYMQVPLDKWLSGSRISYGMTTDNRSRVRNEVGLSGSLLEDNRLTYNVREGYANKGEGNSGGVSANYDGTYGRLNASYSYNQTSHQINAGLNGGVVVHPYGITFAQPLGDTMALVSAPGADGTRVKNFRGVQTDWRGYAVVPYVSAYRKNNVSLSTETLKDDVELESAVKTVIPTRGALVLADYKTNVGARVLATVTYQGKPVPFGATASLIVGGKSIGNSFVGDGGDVYLSGVPEKSQVKIKWGNDATQQCSGDIKLPVQDLASRFKTANIVCR